MQRERSVSAENQSYFAGIPKASEKDNMEGNKGAGPNVGDAGETASRGQSFGTAGGAFVTPATTGNPNLLSVAATQVNQSATAPSMNQHAGTVLGAQVGNVQPITLQNPPQPQSMAPDASTSLTGSSASPSSAEETQGTLGAPTSEGSKDDAGQSSSKKKPKKDRSKLRKGKWTPEEEEYTSRIIHYFSSGILTLPEGTTLRAYLAEKLNCDPMRITKKYAGASCLGKRVYHLCDRPPATPAEVEVAKAELAHLEHRYRLRVEHGQTGIPLPPRTDLLPGAASIFATGQVPSLLQTLATANAAAPGAFSLPVIPPVATGATAGVPVAFPGAAAAPVLAQNALIAGAVPGFTVPASAQGNPLATWAWAQAAASLTPALSQLAAANLQNHQQELQKAYESRLKAIAQQSASGTTSPAPPIAANPQQVNTVANPPAPPPPAPVAVQSPKPAASYVKPNTEKAKQSDSPRSKEDEDAGTMLMGFLSSLRKGYEEALSEREKSEGALSSQSGYKRKSSDERSSSKRQRLTSSRRSVTDGSETASGTTSYPAESSLEDSDERGKTSSSEDSDKDSSERDSSGERGSSSGEGGSVPPRKRMKGKHNVGEFTAKNVAEHNHRMQQNLSGIGSSRWPSSSRDGRGNLNG